MNENEVLFIELLDKLPESIIQKYLLNHITIKNLHSQYIELICKINQSYINEVNGFIEEGKRNVNALYVDKQLGYNVLEKVEINEKNWFWYARLLAFTEDTRFPKRNFLTPNYLLSRLKPIITKLDEKTLDEERLYLKNFCLDLIIKGGEF